MFIEVTKIGQRRTQYKILLNSDMIDYIASDVSGEGSLVHTSSDVYHVKESYDEIKEMLKSKIPVVVSGDGSVEPLKVNYPEHMKVDWSKISENIIPLHETSPLGALVDELLYNMSDEAREKLKFSDKILRSTGIPLKYLIGEESES